MHPLTMLSTLRGEYEAYVDSFQFYKNITGFYRIPDTKMNGIYKHTIHRK